MDNVAKPGDALFLKYQVNSRGFAKLTYNFYMTYRRAYFG